MEFERIFWLDDFPSFLYGLGRHGVNIRELARRTSFAFDFEHGEEILKSGDFDLYVLDGDFPNRLSFERREFLREIVRKIERGEKVSLEEMMELQTGGRYSSQEGDFNFMRFFQKHLEGRDKEVVIYSMNDFAPVMGFNLGLPVYSKRGMFENEKLIQLIKRFYGEKFSDSEILLGERGLTEDFVKRYLI